MTGSASAASALSRAVVAIASRLGTPGLLRAMSLAFMTAAFCSSGLAVVYTIELQRRLHAMEERFEFTLPPSDSKAATAKETHCATVDQIGQSGSARVAVDETPPTREQISSLGSLELKRSSVQGVWLRVTPSSFEYGPPAAAPAIWGTISQNENEFVLTYPSTGKPAFVVRSHRPVVFHGPADLEVEVLLLDSLGVRRMRAGCDATRGATLEFFGPDGQRHRRFP